jgi:hypothetical protein
MISWSHHSSSQQNLVTGKKILTGGRETGGRRRLREREGEVHRREPDLGSVLLSPIAAATALKRQTYHATECPQASRDPLTKLRTKSNRSTAQRRTHLASPPSHRNGRRISSAPREGFAISAGEAGGGRREPEWRGRTMGHCGLRPRLFRSFPPGPTLQLEAWWVVQIWHTGTPHTAQQWWCTANTTCAKYGQASGTSLKRVFSSLSRALCIRQVPKTIQSFKWFMTGLNFPFIWTELLDTGLRTGAEPSDQLRKSNAL